MAHGGKRVNAGRKEGVKIPKLSTYFTDAELRKFVTNLKKRADESDKIAVFLAEQVWGKAPQTIDANLTGTLTITFDRAFTRTPEGDS